MKKLKIFLGGYVNFPNAQNINCDNIAKNLNKDKFEVHTMYSTKMPINKSEYRRLGVHLHPLIHHRFIWYWCKWLTMALGKYDIYYLPKGEAVDRRFAIKHKNKYCFIASVEGVITTATNNSPEYKTYYMEVMDDFYSISNCIEASVEKLWGRQSQVLPLGIVDVKKESRINNQVESIVWVGNINSNKRPIYLLQCAKAFPRLSFTMVGTGDRVDEVKEYIEKEKIENVKLAGWIKNNKVYDYLLESDLLLMTSQYEGLPKVIQEAAQCKVPTIYIAENYRVDFIENGKNGFAVESLEEMITQIQYLLNNPIEYKKMANYAYKAIGNYSWKRLIIQYEKYFTKQYKKKKQGLQYE